MASVNAVEFDLARVPLREVNRYLHRDAHGAGVSRVRITIDLAQWHPRQVKFHGINTRHEYTSAGFGSNTEACLMPGRWASERNSEAIAT